MTIYSYIILADDDPLYGKTKRFSVISDSYQPILDKAGGIVRTINGKLDVTVGAVYDVRSFSVRARIVPQTSDHGTFDDLKYFYSLNRPNAIPSNRLLYTDHYGIQHTAVMVSKFEPKIIGVMLAGQSSSFTVNITLQILPEA